MIASPPRVAALTLAVALAACGDDPVLGVAADVATADGATDGGGRDAARDAARDATRDVPGTDTDGGTELASDVSEGEPVPNQPPVAVAGDDTNGQPLRPLRFDGSESYDPDGRIVSWSWQMGNGVALSGEQVDYTYPAPGLYTVTLTVTDDGGLSDTDSLRVDLIDANERPVATIDGPFEVVMGEENEWNARLSSDDVGIVDWFWTTGVDGDSEHSGQVIEYTYEAWEGRPYRMVLRVVDTDGEESLDTRDIHVMAPPVARVEGPNSGFVGEALSFDATTSYDPDDEAADALAAVRWNFGDGSAVEEQPWRPVYTRPTHTWSAPGRYDVIVGVRDRDGILRDSQSHKVDIFVVPNRAPRPDIDAPSFAVSECDTVAFSAALTVDDSDAATALTYFWDFGDGGSGTGIAPSHVYRRQGTYEVTVTAVDTEGSAGSTSAFVTVSNVRPTAAFVSSPAPGIAGASVNFDATGSSDHCEGPGEDRITGYRWTWGDGVMSTWSASPVASHTYAEAGTYDVTLQVRDDGDPALEHSAPGRVTVIAGGGGGPTVRNYTLATPIAYSCTADLWGIEVEVVSFTFRRFELTLDGTSATARSFSSDPGTMTGTRAAPDRFDVTGFQDGGTGGCDEEYRMTGTIGAGDVITFTLIADYRGSACGTCTRQSWTGRIANPE